MKILKYLLFLLIALIVLFFAAGLIKPNIKYGHQITVDKPIAEAWAVHKDDSKFNQWLEGFKSIEIVSGEPEAVGSKYKVIVEPGEGQPDFEMIETIISFKENDHIELQFDSDMMRFDQITSFSQKDGKTVIKTDSKVTGNGMIMRSMFALMDLFTGSFQSQEMKNIEALKKVINENTTDYSKTKNIIGD